MNKKVLITKNMTFKERIAARKADRERREHEAELQYQADRRRHAAKYGMTVDEYDKHVDEVLDLAFKAVKNMAFNG